MKSLNIKIDESLYEKIRTIGFIQKKPLAVVVRESLQNSIGSQSKDIKEKMELILEAEDEDRILSILAKNEWVSEDEFMRENNLTYKTPKS